MDENQETAVEETLEMRLERLEEELAQKEKAGEELTPSERMRRGYAESTPSSHAASKRRAA
ncbi:MAG: hypothetical protein AVDCRST_MAG45-841 [uncultured Solirubrobacterales bacterium]|uniref:Uncharacterized protein n=1 Tax=uncultured Solirubrobacterales bacterium TaxID=768556 RepID=A0A6J4SGB2_9ACTN|nr:MAG: hypothetical protein AVDCRST_MAG45-841 [uncultured Solirubrobacterales bacterium]